MLHEALWGSVLVNDGHLLLGKAVDYCFIKDGLDFFEPQREIAVGVQADVVSNLHFVVVPVGVSQVPPAYLCRHVPTIEGTPRVLNATYLKDLVGKRRQSVPSDFVAIEYFSVLRVSDWDE